MTHHADPSPYASLIARTAVRNSSVSLGGSVTRLWHYGHSGNARARMLLLHGFRGDHHGLEPIVALLIRVCPDLEVVVPDLPGFGQSPPLPTTRHDVAGYATWAGDLLQVLASDGDIVLGGHSFGSVVAAAAARNHVADKLILINPIPRPPLSGRDVLTVGATAVLHKLAGILPERVGTWVLRHRLLTRVASLAMVRTPDRDLRRWIHAEHDRYFGGFATRASLLEAFTASITASVRRSAERIDVPTLLIGGANDDLARVPHQHALATRFKDARLRIIPDVGHLTHYETPGEVAAEIADFLLTDVRSPRKDPRQHR